MTTKRRTPDFSDGGSCSDRAKFLIVDRAQDDMVQWAKRHLTAAGLTVGDMKSTSTNMDSDEQSDTLGEVYSVNWSQSTRAVEEGLLDGRYEAMIISASYKTDIPTFYGDWFVSRLRAGYCKTLNPYNRRTLRVSLRREDVDGFVFWTKNIGPFLPQLAEVHERDFPFIVQHTINAYPHT